MVQVMQLLLGFLLPLVLAFDTRDNSTTSEPRPTTVYSKSTKPHRNLDGTLDSPVLVGLVHQQRLENDATGVKSTEKSEKFNSNGEYPNEQQITELPIFGRSIHQTEEQIHQIHQTSKQADTDQILGQAVETEETRSDKKLEHQAPRVDFHPKVGDFRGSRPHQNLRHSFEVDDEGRAHLPVDPFSLHHPFLHTSVAEFEYSEWSVLTVIILFVLIMICIHIMVITILYQHNYDQYPYNDHPYSLPP